MTGAFGESVTFGKREANETTLDARGKGDIFVAKYAGTPTLHNVNDLVALRVDPLTYAYTSGNTNCPSGNAGKFSFESALTNISFDTLWAMEVEVEKLTRGNSLLTGEGLVYEGESFRGPY